MVSLAEIALRVFTIVALTPFLYTSGTTFCAAKSDFGSASDTRWSVRICGVVVNTSAAAAGAALGAVKGVKDKDKKEAAEGAALGAITAYLVESGRGRELDLQKGVKLELELERALYLLKE